MAPEPLHQIQLFHQFFIRLYLIKSEKKNKKGGLHFPVTLKKRDHNKKVTIEIKTMKI